MLKLFLGVSGVVAMAIGGSILFSPVGFFARNGIELGGQTGLLSEVRAPGGALLAAGAVIVSGAFVAELTFTATLISAVLYLAYGLSRVLSFAVDGRPTEALVQATVVELVFGFAGVFAFIKLRQSKQNARTPTTLLPSRNTLQTPMPGR